MTASMLYVLCMIIGGISGLRSLTGVAIVSIVAQRGWPHLAWLHLAGTGIAFLGRAVWMYVFAVAAVCELIVDKLPFVPARIQPGPLVWRLLAGGLCSSALALAAGFPWIFPAAIGAIAAIVGSYLGYWLRRSIASQKVKDLPIALLEDATAILLALFVVSRF
jgi:uncharacterized membrane protein